MGCNRSGVPRPSIVVISSPSRITARLRHEFTPLRSHAPCMRRIGVIAALLGSGESNGLTDAIEERCPWVNAKLVVLAVDAQRDGHL